MSTRNERPQPERDRLLAMLKEDTGSVEEAEKLLPTVTRLKKWTAPAPDLQHKTELVRLTRQQISLQNPHPLSFWQRLAEWTPYLLLRAQSRVVQREIWLASALVMILGLIVTLGTYHAEITGAMLPLVMIAPIAAAVGMAGLYSAELEPVLELERGTRTPLRVLLLARMALVFGFDFLLAFCASVILSFVYKEIALWSLVLDWLAPMAFLSALAFLLSVWLRESMAGITFSLTLWFLLVFRRFGVPFLDFLPDLAARGHASFLLLLALLAGVVAVWLAGSERQPTQGIGLS